MAGVTAQGGAFTFNGVSAYITGLSVETPTAEVVDMTAHNAAAGQMVMVPTGHWSGGSVTVDYIHAAGGTDPLSIVRTVGTLSFSSGGYSVSRRAILESATTSARVGDLVRGTLKFRVTDYAGT
jgi:hypothetical protein